MTLNLFELSQSIARHNVQATDAMTSKYIEEVVKHITERGDKVEDYTLVMVNNPMEVIESGLRATMQYRVMKISELQNLPTYGEDL